MKKILQLLIALSLSVGNAQTVSTIAGSGAVQTTNGNGTSASFWQPNGVVKDSNGNIFISEETGRVIRKITPTGDVTVFAGSGNTGNTDGIGTAASFGFLGSLVIDNQDNMYVGDRGNEIIRKITPAGVVTTITSTSGTNCYALCINPNKTIIYCSGNGRQIYSLTIATGQVSLIAGSGSNGNTNGIGTAASFNLPLGLAVNPSDTFLYVSDFNNNNIRKINLSTTEVTTFAGTGISGSNDGTTTNATFNAPIGMVFGSNGDLFISDHFNNKIRKITSTGLVSTVSGTGASGSYNGSALTATYNNPTCLFLENNTNLIITEYGGNSVRRLSNIALSYNSFNSNSLKFSLYPNPANSILNIDLANELQSVEIYSLQGQKVLSSTSKQFNVSDLSSGMYMVRVQDTDGGVATQKFVKQ